MATPVAPQQALVPTPPAASAAAPGQYASGSLYVGDLQQDVTEALLFEIFNQAGPVSSIRVCRDAATRRSLGYAYVNFHNVMDAERALDTLNFTPIKGRPCRIMWSHRDPSIRKSSSSNIFIKNLDKTIDNKALYDTFSSFGNILSCKVAMDSNMQSKGYGFVHYESEEGAKEAIVKVNGMMLSGKQVFVGKFERRSERPGAGGAKFTNIYVKNIPLDWNEAKFRTEFSRFGEITSLLLQKGPDGKHKGFGFVNFAGHEEASRAVDEGSRLNAGDDKTLFVDRFQKKAERSALLAKKFDDIRREKSEKYRNLNLYIKNLDDDVENQKLHEMFAPFGEITSAVVMRDEKHTSRGFGFVCFANSDDASKALNEMNGKMVGSKPIYVNRAQRKEERRMQLESQFQANIVSGQAGQRMQPMPPVYYPNMGMPQPALMFQQQMMGRRFPAQPMRTYPMYPGQAPRPGVPLNARHHQQPKYAGGRGSSPATTAGPRYPARGDHHQAPVPVPAVQAPVVGGHAQAQAQDLTAQLASATPEMQKQLLGERLFPLIQKEQPQLAGKITGMLLEMDVSEILSVLEAQSELHSKIQEALEVLQAHSESS
eukprot:c8947_g1_i2.p1 GENE.c8947_g1_i2~~c8947_g1_i2.p1  ORF type:complete len:620 (-),score=164.03 c8947_g1_i2:218-2011(-)